MIDKRNRQLTISTLIRKPAFILPSAASRRNQNVRRNFSVKCNEVTVKESIPRGWRATGEVGVVKYGIPSIPHAPSHRTPSVLSRGIHRHAPPDPFGRTR